VGVSRFKVLTCRLARLACRYFLTAGGNVGVVVGIALPTLVVGGGGAIDYGLASSARRELQGLADGASLAATKSLLLSNSTPQSVASFVQSFVSAQPTHISPITVSSSVSSNPGTVAVQLDADYSTVFLRMAGMSTIHISTKAAAKLVGGSIPNCLIALDVSAGGAVNINKGGLVGSSCMLYSDSTATNGFKVSGGATVSAGAICSAGGEQHDNQSTVTPLPRLDCPNLADPLASQPSPNVGPCTELAMNVKNQSTTLLPGVYCSGLQVSGTSTVSLSPGLYVIKDGPLHVSNAASLQGSDVTFYLTGQNAIIDFDNQTTIDLAAPKNGAFAGMLVFEDRTVTLNQHHQIKSRNAPNMLGTIYLSRGILNIGIQYGGGGKGTPVAQSSAWTVVIARKISIQDDMQIVFNTNYAASPVHPPAGLSSANTGAVLSQ
jgi:Flp pilus assembly protein TadG